jgi:hypothetical protein
MPIDTLKIDRSFVNHVDCDPEKIEMIRTIVSLAWNLGIDVVAEGVETKKQMYQLQALRCDYAQGYYFSRPVDAAAAKTLKQFELNGVETHSAEPIHQMSTRNIKLFDSDCQQATQQFLLSNLLDLDDNNLSLKGEDESTSQFKSPLRWQ